MLILDSDNVLSEGRLRHRENTASSARVCISAQLPQEQEIRLIALTSTTCGVRSREGF